MFSKIKMCLFDGTIEVMLTFLSVVSLDFIFKTILTILAKKKIFCYLSWCYRQKEMFVLLLKILTFVLPVIFSILAILKAINLILASWNMRWYR